MRKRGFTLIELVATMVILAALGVVFVYALEYGIRGFLSNSDQTDLAQKSRLALTRMYIELTEMNGLDPSPSGTQNEDNLYFLDHDGNAASLRLAGGAVTLNGRPLVDGLGTYGAGEHLFTFTSDRSGTSWSTSDGFDALYEVEILLVIEDAAGREHRFTASANPRFSTVANAPKLE